MPAKSKQQQKFMGLVHAYKKGEVPASKVSSAIKQAAKSMSKKSVKKYAKTKHDDLPKKVKESKTSNMMKAIRKHGTAGPWDIIVSKNNKIKKRVSVKNLKEIPAEMDDIRKKFPNHKFGIEAKSGRIAYREEKKACMCEACQKGYMTHPTRKTKIMFGKRYRNCVKKEDVNEYTYGIGDIVKDINPTCPHNGAMGRVKSVNPKSVVFVVINKGKNYKPGDVLDKTHDQMKKMELSENLQDRMKDVMKGLAKSLKLKSVVSMHTGSGSFSYFMDDKSEVNKLASMLKKKLKRVRIIKLDKSKGDTANFVVAADLFNI